MKTLLSALAQHAAAGPTRPALLIGKNGSWTQFTYRDLLEETERWARILARSSPLIGSVVFIVLEHRPELYPAFLGAMRAGFIPSFLPYPTPKQDPELYWRAHAELFARVQPGAVVSYRPATTQIAELVDTARSVVLDADALRGHDADAPLLQLSAVEHPERIALLQYSSGTTGLKKGVALTYCQIREQVSSYAAAIDAAATDRIVSWLPLYHDMGLVTAFLLPITIGGMVVSIDAFEWLAHPEMIFEVIGRYRGTLAWLPNFALNHLVRTRDPSHRYDLSSLRALINCSEPCKLASMETFRTAFADDGLLPTALQTCYAMAETVFAVTQSSPGAPPRSLSIDGDTLATRQVAVPVSPFCPGAAAFISCGRAIDGIEVAIEPEIAASGGPDGGCPVGELHLRGRFLFGEYYRNPAATAAAYVNGWYKTGDVGFLHDGELFVCGRIKEMLIVHGRNYYAHDIEEVVSTVLGVKPGRAVAFGISDPKTGSEEAVALVECTLDSEAERATLCRQIRKTVYDRLELKLRRIELCRPGDLVKTTSGKISREENRKRFAERQMQK
jgi:fatty-acyl-CoA synthase